MVIVAAVIFLDMIAPFGERATRWIAVAPGSVPGLTEPGAGGMTDMQMEMR